MSTLDSSDHDGDGGRGVCGAVAVFAVYSEIAGLLPEEALWDGRSGDDGVECTQ